MGMREKRLFSPGDLAGSAKHSTTGDSEPAVGDETGGLDPESETETHDSDTESEAASDESDDEADELGWLTDPWYRTRAGVTMLLIDVGLTVVFASMTMTTFVSDVAPILPPESAGHIPWFVYAFSALGGLGYVFTALLEDFQSETKSLFKYNLRVPAALPLGAGVWILSAVLIGEGAANELVLGLVFLSGLYVNLAYERLGAVARRLLPDSKTDESEEEPEAEASDESDAARDEPLDEHPGTDDSSPKRDSPPGTPSD